MIKENPYSKIFSFPKVLPMLSSSHFELQSETTKEESLLFAKKYALPKVYGKIKKSILWAIVNIVFIIILPPHLPKTMDIHSLLSWAGDNIFTLIFVALLILQLYDIVKMPFILKKFYKQEVKPIKTIYSFNDTDFSVNLADTVTLKFKYSDVNNLENLNNFLVLQVKNTLNTKKEDHIFAIYSNAFTKISINDFLEWCKNKMPINAQTT